MTYEAVRSISLVCDGGQDLPIRRFVTPSSTGIGLTGASGDAIGVSLELYDDSQYVLGEASNTISVALLDGAKIEVEAGAAVTAGATIKSDSTGRAVAGTAGVTERILGYALTAAGGAGETITIVGSKAGFAAQS